MNTDALGQGRRLSASGPGDSGQIEKVIGDARLVQPVRLFHDVPRLIAFVHEEQRRIVSRLHADGQAVVPQAAELPERFIGFPSHIGHPREAADGPALREVLADAPRDGLQPLRLKRKGVCPHQKDPCTSCPRSSSWASARSASMSSRGESRKRKGSSS